MRRLAIFGSVVLLLSIACSSKTNDPAASLTTEPIPAALVTAAREIVTAVDEGRWQDARKDFDATMRKKLPATTLALSWAAFTREFGDLESQGEAELVDSQGLTVVNVELDMEKKPGQARISFDNRGKVSGLFFLETGVPVP